MASTLFVDTVTQSAAAWFNDVDTASYSYLSGVAGTNTVTATGPNSMTAYAAGQRFWFIPANTNTGATTLNITANSVTLGAKNIFAYGAAVGGGELVAGIPTAVVYDGIQFNIINPQPRFSTWTPVLTFATPGNLSVTYTTQVGTWSKIGKLTALTFNIVTSAFTHTTASGNLQITGSPFTAQATAGQLWYGSLTWAGITKANYTQVNVVAVQNSNILLASASGSTQAASNIAAADTPTGGTVQLTGNVVFVATA